MATQAPEHTAPANSKSHAVEPWREFAAWAADQLGLELTETPEGPRVRELTSDEPAAEPPTSDSRLWPNALRPRRRREAASVDQPVDFTADSPTELVQFLFGKLAALETRPTIAPVDQPTAAHEIADRLFGAYQIDGGKIHLAGCRLETTRLVRWSEIGDSADGVVVHHRFTTEAGEPIDGDLAATLGLAGPMVPADAANCGGRSAPVGATEAADQAGGVMATATLIARRAAGALQASIDGVDVAIPFDDWARTLTAPPAVCPETGIETFHLLAIDDGRVVAAEATDVCEATGRRLLIDDLRTCSVTGKRLAAELCVTCPVTGKPVAEQEMVVCPQCQQLVSRKVAGDRDCEGCRGGAALPSGDPRREALLAEVPLLAKWRRLRVAETQTVRIVKASTLWRRLIVVVDRETGSPVYAATRGRLGRSWTPLPLNTLRG